LLFLERGGSEVICITYHGDDDWSCFYDHGEDADPLGRYHGMHMNDPEVGKTYKMFDWRLKYQGNYTWDVWRPIDAAEKKFVSDMSRGEPISMTPQSRVDWWPA
jgi:hypothetical protein